jgi:FtsZ-interacting cell division protein ZipA
MAHIRAPNPQNYFPRRQETSTSEQEPLDDTGHRSRNTDQIVTNHQESSLETDNETINVQPRKSKRNASTNFSQKQKSSVIILHVVIL